MSRTGHRSAKLNKKTRLRLIVQPGHSFRQRSYPYLYRVGLQTILNELPSNIYLSDWTESLDEANDDFDHLLAALDGEEEDND